MYLYKLNGHFPGDEKNKIFFYMIYMLLTPSGLYETVYLFIYL